MITTAYPPLSRGGDLPLLTETTQCRDPQEVYRRFSRDWTCPIRPVFLEPGVPAWLIMGFRQICDISRDDGVFSHDPHNWNIQLPPDSGLLAIMGYQPNCLFHDGAEHTRLRDPLYDGFATVDEDILELQVRDICRDLLVPHLANNSIDLVSDYAQPVPMMVVAALFGLPADVRLTLAQAMSTMFSAGDDSLAASDMVETILADALHAHAGGPGDNLTSVIAHHPQLHTDTERVKLLLLTLTAGWMMTSTLIAQTLRRLCTDRRFAARLSGGRLGIDDAINDALNLEPPMANMPARYPLDDVLIAGQPVKKGDCLVFAYAAGNHDPAVHPGPPPSGSRAHLAWGRGPHVCPAPHVARVIAATAVSTAFRVLRDLTLDTDPADLTYLPSPWTRCPASLRASFEPARSALGPDPTSPRFTGRLEIPR